MDYAEELTIKLDKLDKTLTEPLKFIFEEIIKLSSEQDKEKNGAYVRLDLLQTFIKFSIGGCMIDLFENALKIFVFLKKRANGQIDKNYSHFIDVESLAEDLKNIFINETKNLIKEYETGKINESSFAVLNKLKEIVPTNADIFDEQASFLKKINKRWEEN